VGEGVTTVFVDFGREGIHVLRDDSDKIQVFDDLIVEGLQPRVVVAYSYPRRLQPVIAGLAVRGITFLRDLKKVAEIRRDNGISKNDENDARILRELFYRRPDCFQPLYTTLEELTVRALTELWAQMTSLKKNSKQARTATDNQLAVEIHRTQVRIVERLSERNT
jgi:hypothetical protein